MIRTLGIACGAADRAGRTTFLVDQAAGDRQGDLYVAASGSDEAVALVLQTVRDNYYAQLLRERLPDPGASLAAALATADALLRHRAPGSTSCVAAAVVDGRLFLAYTGLCGALLDYQASPACEVLTRPELTLARLGTDAGPQIGQGSRLLQPGDAVVLWTGSSDSALAPATVRRALRAEPQADPEAIALTLADTSRAEELSVIVLAAEVDLVGVRPPEPDEAWPDERTDWGLSDLPSRPESTRWPGVARALHPEGWPGEDRPATLQRRGRTSIRQRLAGLVGRGPRPRIPRPEIPRPMLIAGAIVAVIGTSWLAAAPLQATPPAASPTPPAATAVATPAEDTVARIDRLWLAGDRGDGTVWAEVVRLLEGVRAERPGDRRIEEKLIAARLNRLYVERMAEADTCWGGVEGARTASWATCVETLEGLYRETASSGYARRVRDRLYTAHLSYGQALVSAGRATEARGQFERARELDSTRPEAVEQLRRLGGR